MIHEYLRQLLSTFFAHILRQFPYNDNTEILFMDNCTLFYNRQTIIKRIQITIAQANRCLDIIYKLNIVHPILYNLSIRQNTWLNGTSRLRIAPTNLPECIGTKPARIKGSANINLCTLNPGSNQSICSILGARKRSPRVTVMSSLTAP